MWACWFYFTFSVFFIVYLIPFVVLMKWKRSHRFLHSLRSWFLKVQLVLSGIIIRKRIEGKLPKRGVIFCFNHSSMLDIFIPMAALNRQLRFVGKKELAKIPLFGIVFSRLDVSIDRESSKGAYESLEQAADLLGQGIDIVIAPEGTTSPNAPELLPFKNGPFWLAERTQAPIVPIVFRDNWRLFHYDKKWSGRPGVSRMQVLDVIAPLPADDLKATTRAAMHKALNP